MTPTNSAFRATSAGGSASSPVGVNGASLTRESLTPQPDGTFGGVEGFDVAAAAARLAEQGGGYEVVHTSPGLEIGVYVLVAPEPDRQTPHAFDEVYVVLDGEGEIEVEGERRRLSQGEAVFVAAEADHRFSGYERLTLLVIFNGPHAASKSR